MAEVGGQAAGATFELERFTWETADQLAVTGIFTELTDAPSDAPLVVVHGERATHRLVAVAGRVAWPPEDGAPWSAAFAWSDPPTPFTTARRELGDGRHVELPEPSARRPRFGRRVLALRGTDDADERGSEGDEAGAVALAAEPEPDAPAPDERVGLHADLVRAREDAMAVTARAQDAEERLARADADAETERARRAADGERFREALAALQTTADEALAAERAANAELGDDLLGAHAELDRLRSERDDLRGRVESAERAAGERQADAQRLRERLASIRNALSEDG
jgi:hypothetical protein